jgi:hypothetical protein
MITLNGDTGITTPGLINTGSTTLINLTTTGNTILGDQSTDTLNVANGNLILDSSGDLGLGVTPAAWSGGYVGLQVKDAAFASFSSGYTWVGNNWYNNSGNKYIGTGTATLYEQNAGKHAWFTAPSGTAGNAISFTQAMTLDASGNLLVGTTASQQKLTLQGEQRFYNPAGDGTSNVTLGRISAQVRNYGSGIANNSFASIEFCTDPSAFWYRGDIRFFTNGSDGTASAGTERVRIDSSGNLLLGTTSATYGGQLTVKSVGQTSLSLQNSNFVAASAGTQLNSYFGATTGNTYAALQVNSGGGLAFNDLVLQPNGGNLGIGTTSPISRLHVNSTASALVARFDTTQSGGAIAGFFLSGSANGYVGANGPWLGNSATDMMIAAEGGKAVCFYTNGSATERARIDSNGNFLIGNTGGTNRLTVASATQAAAIYCANERNVSGDFSFITTLGSNCNNTSSYHIISATGGSDRFYVFGNGNVVNTNNSYGSLSDVKLKENIADASPKLADLMQVKVRNYNLIGQTTKQLGVVAQELETIFPALVDKTPDKDAEGNDLGTTTKSVKYSVFVPMLIKAIQELKAELDSVKSELATIKGAA